MLEPVVLKAMVMDEWSDNSKCMSGFVVRSIEGNGAVIEGTLSIWLSEIS